MQPQFRIPDFQADKLVAADRLAIRIGDFGPGNLSDAERAIVDP